MTTWLTVKQAQEYFNSGRESIKLEARLAGALIKPLGRSYRIDRETLDYYRKTKQKV